MQEEKKISVCIPFYNLEAYAGRCLDSVLGNTYRNLEVLCVDDGSTDRTREILSAYAARDSRVQVIEKENGGLVSARNAAIDRITGDFTAFIDGDDWVHARYFERLMAVQHSSGADVVICDYEPCSERTADAPLPEGEIPYRSFGVEGTLKIWRARTLLWGRIYASGLVRGVHGPEEISMGEDSVFNLLFLCRSERTRIAVTEEKLYRYFQREGSLVHTQSHGAKIRVALYWKEHYDAIGARAGRQIVLHEMLRDLLSYRYLEMFRPGRAERKACCAGLYAFCRARWAEAGLPLREWLRYRLLYRVPAAYRFGRILADPSLLKWERAERGRGRERHG